MLSFAWSCFLLFIITAISTTVAILYLIYFDLCPPFPKVTINEHYFGPREQNMDHENEEADKYKENEEEEDEWNKKDENKGKKNQPQTDLEMDLFCQHRQHRQICHDIAIEKAEEIFEGKIEEIERVREEQQESMDERKQKRIEEGVVESMTEIRATKFEMDHTTMMIHVKSSIGRIVPSLVNTESHLEPVRQVGIFYIEHFDWRKEEKRLNDLPQFTTNIMGMRVHFIHIVQEAVYRYHPKSIALPLLLVHGFPSCSLEFLNLIPHLIEEFNKGDNEGLNKLEIIIPTLPGSGLSPRPLTPGFSHKYAALTLKLLMERLGHRQFYCHGTDWNSGIPSALAAYFPESVKGLHLIAPYSRTGSAILKTALCSLPFMTSRLVEKEDLEKVNKKFPKVQKPLNPDKEGIALCSFPLCLISWLLDQSHLTDSHLTVAGLEFLVNTAASYWVANSVTALLHFHAENYKLRVPSPLNIAMPPVTVPTGVCDFPDSVVGQPRTFLTGRYSNIIHWSRINRGGQFPAVQFPEKLAEHIVKFVINLEET